MTSPRLLTLALSLAIALSAGMARADTLTFQQGDGGAYSTTDAAMINESGLNWGSHLVLTVVTGSTAQTLIRFPDIIGGNPGQVPPGSTITSATLTLMMYFPNSEFAPTDIHRVLVDWDEDTVTGFGFWSQPGTLYGPKVGSVPVDEALVSADVTTLVQAWSGGDPNFGIMLRLLPPEYDPSGFNTTQYYSDDAPDLVQRPKLVVEFTAPVATEATTWGKVKALYR